MINSVLAQNICKVQLKEISGTYEGDCKKGYADGEGIAIGEDTYEGEFKKGLPHGLGTYTWSNGDVFKGEFKNGIKSGKGELFKGGLNESESVITGFWKKDKYVEKNEKPYEVLSKIGRVTILKINESDNQTNTLYITLNSRGKTVPNPNFTLNTVVGNYLNIRKSGRTTNILVGEFPFHFTISNFMDVEIIIRQKGSYNITIDRPW